MNYNEIYDKLHRQPFSIGRATPQRGADCLAHRLNIEDYTDNEDLFFTDNWLPIELNDVPGKYVWIGFRAGRGKTLRKFLPLMKEIANKIHGAEVFDYTDSTSMLFLFIQEN